MKRIVLAILLLLGICSCQVVFSQDYNVLIFPQNSQIATYIETFFISKEVSTSIYTDISTKKLNEKLKTSGEALAKAYSSEKEASIIKAREEYQSISTDDYSLNLEISDVMNVVLTSFNDNSIDMDNVIRSNDLLTLDYICSSSNSDLVLIPLIGEIGGFKHFVLYSYSSAEKNLNLIFEEISQSATEYSLMVLLKLSSLFSNNGVSVLTFDGLIQGSSVYVDGELVSLIDSSIVLSSGPHTIDIELIGYETKHLTLEINANTVNTVFVQMDKNVYDGLLVKSTPNAIVSSDGKIFGTTPYTINEYTLPLMLNFSAIGFNTKTVSLNEARNSISVELKPTWMNDEESFEKAQTSFYNSFARSLLIFGLKIISKTFCSNYNDFWMATDTLCTGALFLSLTDLAVDLIDYYKYSEYISP